MSKEQIPKMKWKEHRPPSASQDTQSLVILQADINYFEMIIYDFRIRYHPYPYDLGVHFETCYYSL